jgi:pantothenate kinase-related protein Tda10
MDFNIDSDFGIFDPLLKKRPEMSPDLLKQDLKNYYIPYVQKLLKLKEEIGSSKGLVVGVSAIQGAGKTTQGEVLEILLGFYKKSSVSLSIDDHYITHKELTELRNKDPRFIRRGVTHDVPLAVKNLTDLINYSFDPVLVSGYDKGVQNGDGDRFAWINPVDDLKIVAQVSEEEVFVDKNLQKVPVLKILASEFAGKPLDLPQDMGSFLPVLPGFLPDELIAFLKTPGQNQITVLGKDSGAVYFVGGQDEIAVDKKDLPGGWRVIWEKPDFIFYDGWMVGAREVADESVFDSGLPALETEEAREFAKLINKRLKDYTPLWELIEFMNVLYVPDYRISLKWREQAEEALRSKGGGMSPDQIREFVYYFWRSVHPAIQIKNLATNEDTQQVVVINDDHSIKEVLTPGEVKIRYP